MGAPGGAGPEGVSRPLGPTILLGSLIVLISVLSVLGTAGASSSVPAAAHLAVAPTTPGGSMPGPSAAPAPALSTTSYTPLALSISAVPHEICIDDSALCSAQTGESRVTLTAAAPQTGLATWPDVQVAFVIETTAYDGVYDSGAFDPGNDKCGQTGGTLCEESNGVPFFVAHAQQIANAIAEANPHSNVSFALVDYFATYDAHDDGDGSEYHVDIPQFVPSGAFGGQVQSTFQANVLGGGYIYGDSDLSDNQLHSSIITAMFGTIIGSGLDWSPQTHHVIVWMGSTAPRDPDYIENYAVSMSDYASGDSSTCEPSYPFGTYVEPNCEGWVHSQDGNATHSIAGLAKSSPTCTDSIGGVCTVDMIDLYDTLTDPTSPGWPCPGGIKGTIGQEGGCPDGPAVRENTAHVLLAGCDMSAATGGTWDGPEFFSCPNGGSGTLQPVFVGSDAYQPNLNNPSLFQAFRQVGFGPVVGTEVANGTHQPLFQYIPIGSIRLVPDQTNITAYCLTASGQPFPYCDKTPATVNVSNLGPIGLGWNWSDKPGFNQMHLGDVWTVSFLVYADGPPTTTVPVDACTTKLCAAEGSHAVGSAFTEADYIPSSNNTVLTQSFPPAQVVVQPLPVIPPAPVPPPPPPPVPPPIPIAAPAPVPVLSVIGVSAQVGVATISLQAVTAGLLGAGFIRVATRNRPIANPVLAGKQAKAGSKFDQQSSKGGVGRFE
jgi:hypothetical protein